MSKLLPSTKYPINVSTPDNAAINSKEKFLWADTMRAIATISVILLHMSGTALYQFKKIPYTSWWVANLYDSSVRFCVPIFVMLSGALLLKQEVSLTYFLKRRLLRIALPFVFWTIIYYFIDFYTQRQFLAQMTLFEKAKWTLVQLETGTATHLWYLYMIVGLYLFVPIIGKWARHATDRELQYFLLLWVITLIFNLPFIGKVKFNFDARYFTGYLGYMVLGYYLTSRTIQIKINTAYIYLTLFVASVAFTALATFFLSYREGLFSGAIYDYLTPNVLLMSFSLFMIVKDATVTNTYLRKAISIVSKYSFGIYFIHMIFLTLFAEIGLTWALIHPIVGIPLMTLTCLLFSTASIYLLSKIPYGKQVI